VPQDTSRFDTGEAARQLCDRWRATSLRVGWAFPADWWVPAVDAVAEALCDGRDPAPPCAELGRSRAEAGVGLEEALADLVALHAAVTETGTADAAAGPPVADPPAAGPPVADPPVAGGAPGRLVQALALGWADVMCDPTAGATCEDPLTGLAVPAYLRVRLGEIYREGERRGLPVPATHALVVAEVELSGGGSLTQLSRSVLLAECLRATFSGGETLCGLAPGRVVALARRASGLAAWAATLRRLLAAELDPLTEQPARVWIEGLPGTLAAAHRLLAELTR
jgi:hypothetical protein